MKNQKKGAELYIDVTISTPGTTSGLAPLYCKLYHLPVREAIALAGRKIDAGYAVHFDFAGDEETFFQPLGWEALK